MRSHPERVLITGASGFVGSCLARRLLDDDQEVHLLLRSPDPWRLSGLEGRYVHHVVDIRDRSGVQAAFRACQPDVVYHLAAHGAYPTQHDRATILATNLLGTANVLEAAAEVGYRALIHSGSSSEYGHKDEPMRSAHVLEPRTDYAVAKAAATLLCQTEALRGQPVTTVRIFTAYGPWDDPGRLVPSVMASCLRGEAPVVTSGLQPRDFVYIGDVLDLLLRASTCSAAHGRILHAGTGRAQTVREMVEVIVAVCSGSNLRPRFGDLPLRSDEPHCWVADVTETTALTGWRPQWDLRSGVEQTWRWLVERASRSQPLAA